MHIEHHNATMHICQLGKRKAFLVVFFTRTELEGKNQDTNLKENCSMARYASSSSCDKRLYISIACIYLIMNPVDHIWRGNSTLYIKSEVAHERLCIIHT